MGKIQIPHTDHRPLEKNHHCISIKIEIGSSTPKNKKKTVAFHAIFTRRHSGIGFVVYGDNALPSAVGRQRAIIGHHIICFWWQWPLNAGGTRPLNPKKGAKSSRKGRFSGFWIRPFWVVGILVCLNGNLGFFGMWCNRVVCDDENHGIGIFDRMIRWFSFGENFQCEIEENFMLNIIVYINVFSGSY